MVVDLWSLVCDVFLFFEWAFFKRDLNDFLLPITVRGRLPPDTPRWGLFVPRPLRRDAGVFGNVLMPRLGVRGLVGGGFGWVQLVSGQLVSGQLVSGATG